MLLINKILWLELISQLYKQIIIAAAIFDNLFCKSCGEYFCSYSWINDISKPYEFLPFFCDILQHFSLMWMYNCYTLDLKPVSQHDFITYTYVYSTLSYLYTVTSTHQVYIKMIQKMGQKQTCYQLWCYSNNSIWIVIYEGRILSYYLYINYIYNIKISRISTRHCLSFKSHSFVATKLIYYHITSSTDLNLLHQHAKLHGTLLLPQR